MDGYAGGLAGALLGVDQDFEREFEARLVESSTLAFRLAYSVLRQREDAEEVAQEAFTRAYRNFAQLRDRNRFRAWLARTAWRLAIDRQRSDRRRLRRDAIHMAQTPAVTPPDEVEARQRADALWRAIDALPEKLRMVVVLANIEENDMKGVAALLGAPEGTIKSRLFEARKQLKEQLAWMQKHETR